MKSVASGLSVILTIALTMLVPQLVAAPPEVAGQGFIYPAPRQADVVEDYHGTKVVDPYRWMEDLDAPEVAEWVEAENKVTFAYLEQIPQRAAIGKRLTELWDYEKYGSPFKEGNRYFFQKNDGLQNQFVLYVTDSLEGQPRVLLDPNKLSADGTVALSSYEVTQDGKLMAYGLADAGSDWQVLHVRDVETGQDLPDEIKWVKFSGVSWTKDAKGFYYSRYDEPKGENVLQSANYFQKLYFHRLGTTQNEDLLVYERPDNKDWGFSGDATDDGRYLIISVWQGTERKNRVYYQDLQTESGDVVKLLDDFDAEYDFINNDGPVFWFKTDLEAPRGRVIAIDTTQPDRKNWKELIPQTEQTLEGVSVVNDQFVATYMKDAQSQVRVFDLKGAKVRDVELPGIGSAGGFGGKRTDTETFYSYNSFTTPPTVFRYDMTTGKSTIFKQAKVNFNPDEFVTQQVFYQGKDGTRIPMFITHKKDLKLDGNNPTYLYSYGGFNISLKPRFSVSDLVWMEMGGVFAMPNIRGGGEYGKEWHDAGRLKNKQNCFDDFIAAAEWLIANKYTSNKKLAIGGASNGGLLVGACMTQRPDLFAACLPSVGVLDMYRFQHFTIGWAWVSDYGDSKDKEMFETQAKYSPLHNLKKGTRYPSTLITTADHDDRVVPSHSFKFAATLQQAHAGENPVLIRIETRAGHGAGKPTAKIIEEVADKWAFLVRELGMESVSQ